MRLALLVALALQTPVLALAQDPAELGSFTVTEWEVGSVTVGARALTGVVVAYPDEPGARPIVGVFHGYEGESGDHALLTRTLASHGMVALRATLPCRIATGCDHDANAALIIGLLDWLEAEGERAGGALEGRIDGTRRGLIGHSFGALNSHVAGTMDPRIGSIVLLDPNDDAGSPGRLAAGSSTAPTAQLLAELPGSCNALWNEDAITPLLPLPSLELTVDRSAHCDPADVADALCMFGCGTGDRSTSPVFRRYAVAWTACNLAGDVAMADWLGGDAMADDTAAGTIVGVTAAGLEMLACREGAPPVDAGPAPDAGTAMDVGGDDAGAPDDAAPAMDGGSMTTDAPSSSPDAGPPASAGGCGCASTSGSGVTIAPILLALALVRARRARLRQLTSP